MKETLVSKMVEALPGGLDAFVRTGLQHMEQVAEVGDESKISVLLWKLGGLNLKDSKEGAEEIVKARTDAEEKNEHYDAFVEILIKVICARISG